MSVFHNESNFTIKYTITDLGAIGSILLLQQPTGDVFRFDDFRA